MARRTRCSLLILDSVAVDIIVLLRWLRALFLLFEVRSHDGLSHQPHELAGGVGPQVEMDLALRAEIENERHLLHAIFPFSAHCREERYRSRRNAWGSRRNSPRPARTSCEAQQCRRWRA